MRFFIVDKRYGAVRTLAKRMELFAAWQEGRAGEERKERQAAREAAKEAFTQLLLEARLEKGTEFKKAERQLSADPRWQALEPHLREGAFEDAEGALRRQEKQRRAERQAARQARADALVLLLKEQGLAPDAEWEQVRGMAGVVEDARWTAMEDDEEREEAWGQYGVVLAKERKQKAKRAFAALLNEQQAAGVLGRKSKWREALAVVEEEERYKELKELSADAPAAAFDRWVDEVRERYVRHAKMAKELAVRAGEAVFAEGEDLESFKAALAKQRAADAEAAAEAARAKEAAEAAAATAAEAREGEGEGEGEAVGALRAELRAVLAELQEARKAVAEHEAAEAEEEGKGGASGAAKGAGGAEAEEEVLGEDALNAVLAVLLEKRHEAQAEADKKRKKAERRFREMLDDKCRDLALSGTSFSAWERVREVTQRERLEPPTPALNPALKSALSLSLRLSLSLSLSLSRSRSLSRSLTRWSRVSGTST